ncbi:chemokine (C-C motif) receptor 12a [Salminus brasiliensis]|uniref:chemokine (C-C motif) receptor 12a n=1 Tax=Salminus brasiliensis TaxID=930266 RepID=UPI003B830FE5
MEAQQFSLYLNRVIFLFFLLSAGGFQPCAVMDTYQDALDFFDEYNYTDNDTAKSYITDKEVTLCEKTNVNRFGAKFLPVFYYMNFLLSLLGNGLVLCIIYKFENLSTVTNIFLLNLVISDLLFASSLPFWAVYHKSEWIFGHFLCKLVGSLYSIGFYSSILFLTLMTFDRYLAVVHAITAAQSRRRMYAFISSGVVWLLSLLASIKDMVLYGVRSSNSDGLLCEETGYSQETMVKWQKIGYYQQFGLFFLLPLMMVFYCYGRITVRIVSTRMREKCRAVKLIFVIIFTFFICWTPYNVVILLMAIRLSSDDTSCADDLDYALYITRNLAYLYCCISPVFYTFVGKKFQSHFCKLLARHMPCLKITILSSQSSRTTSFKSPNTEY